MLSRPQVLSHVPQAIHTFIYRDDMGIELIGFRRGGQPPFRTVKQGITQLLLGMGKHLADRGLRNPENFGRPGDRATGVDRMENFDMAQPHCYNPVENLPKYNLKL